MQSNDLAFVFPGQGSQSVGMLTELAESFPEIRQVFAEASEILQIDLWKIVAEGPPEHLNQTENTQPIMLTAGVAVWRVWQGQSSRRPIWMAGHSLGEITALVCADSLRFEDAVALVKRRAELMQQAVPTGVGAMAAVMGLDDPVIVEICRKISEPDCVVAPANFNSPGQVVIAGHAKAIDLAIAALNEAGARRAVVLPVSVPSHCELMNPAAQLFAEVLSDCTFSVPAVPVVHNFDVATHSAADVIRGVLTKQLCNPVRWVDSMRFLHDQGVTKFVECGPGKVLSGLNKRIVKPVETYPLTDLAALENAVEKCV